MSYFLEYNWENFKALVDSKKLLIQYSEVLNKYYLFAADNNIIYVCNLDRPSPEAVVFETNYKVDSNKRVIDHNLVYGSFNDGTILPIKVKPDGSLISAIYGSADNGTTIVPIKTNVDGSLVSTIVYSIDNVYNAETYTTTDTFSSVRVFDVKAYKTKEIIIKNIGNNSARINVLASVDLTNFDIYLANNVLLDAGNMLEINEERAFTNIKIEAKSNVAGNPTTLQTKGYALGA